MHLQQPNLQHNGRIPLLAVLRAEMDNRHPFYICFPQKTCMVFYAVPPVEYLQGLEVCSIVVVVNVKMSNNMDEKQEQRDLMLERMVMLVGWAIVRQLAVTKHLGR